MQVVEEGLSPKEALAASSNPCSLPMLYRHLNALRKNGIDWKKSLKKSKVKSSKPKPMAIAKEKVVEEEASSASRTWEEMFYQLVLYQSRHNGSTSVLINDPKYSSLAKWVAEERKLYQQYYIKGECKDGNQINHVAALNQIGFLWRSRVL